MSGDGAFKNPEKGKGTELHPDLMAEAAERGVTAHLSVTLVRLITEHLYPNADGRVDLTALAADQSREQIVAFLEEHLSDPAITTSMHVHAMGLPPSVTDFMINYVENVRDVTLTKLQEIDNGQVVHSFTARCEVELDVSVDEPDAETFGWPIRKRYGHGDVTAVVHRRAEVSGLVTLSPFGLAVAAEAAEWYADPEIDYGVWDEECGCFTSPHARREPRVIFARFAGPS